MNLVPLNLILGLRHLQALLVGRLQQRLLDERHARDALPLAPLVQLHERLFHDELAARAHDTRRVSAQSGQTQNEALDGVLVLRALGHHEVVRLGGRVQREAQPRRQALVDLPATNDIGTGGGAELEPDDLGEVDGGVAAAREGLLVLHDHLVGHDRDELQLLAVVVADLLDVAALEERFIAFRWKKRTKVMKKVRAYEWISFTTSRKKGNEIVREYGYSVSHW